MNKLELESLRFFKELGHLQKYVIACSGGLDSMVLLDLCARFYKKHPRFNFTVSYIDHNQRNDTHEDKKLVSMTAKKHGFSFHSICLNLPRPSSEEALRDARYLALKKLARSRIVLTAHHADDDLETFLFRLIRGTHPDSLRGISWRSTKNIAGKKMSLGRPLLNFWKEDLYEYALLRSIHYHEDSTNTDAKYFRNQIRIELIPMIEKLRKGSRKRLLLFFRDLAEKNIPDHDHAIGKSLDSGCLVQDLQFKQLKAEIDTLLGKNSQRTTQSHWQSLLRQLKLAQKLPSSRPKRIQFPGGHSVLFESGRLFWVKE